MKNIKILNWFSFYRHRKIELIFTSSTTKNRKSKPLQLIQTPQSSTQKRTIRWVFTHHHIDYRTDYSLYHTQLIEHHMLLLLIEFLVLARLTVQQTFKPRKSNIRSIFAPQILLPYNSSNSSIYRIVSHLPEISREKMYKTSISYN